jgi:hypothetical protein
MLEREEVPFQICASSVLFYLDERSTPDKADSFPGAMNRNYGCTRKESETLQPKDVGEPIFQSTVIASRTGNRQ